MAKAATADDAAEAPKKSKKKLIIIIVVLVLLLLVGGAAAFFMMAAGAHDADAYDEHADEMAPEEDSGSRARELRREKARIKKEAEAKGLPPVFVELDPFTVNLQPESSIDQYLQVKASLRVDEAHAADQLKNYMPEIRHHVLLLLSGKKASELSQPAGREALATEILHAVNAIVGETPRGKNGEPEEPIGPVESVLFTSFIIQ
ncbi:MAG: flagellar basal body-associated FliL family protein [Gammaproteobacteria bacterium]|jgi:flagellar protein FliL|nr:flagellar basal body-associated FliL family protein [Gammaproteobacteria bacterium]MBU1846325.1 flagellar basal body-associated FliL family protein [Gammaproteobacteria bacterium]